MTTGKANEVNYWVFDYAPEEEVLDEQLAPVLDSVTESGKRVFEVLSTKEYKESKQNRYIELFREIENGANSCTNISTLRGYADRAETLLKLPTPFGVLNLEKSII